MSDKLDKQIDRLEILFYGAAVPLVITFWLGVAYLAVQLYQVWP